VRRARRWLAADMSDSTPSPESVFTDADALVVYASTHGHTTKIATRIADAMRADGIDVDLRAVEDAADAKPGRYRLVVVGASLHEEHHQKHMCDWVRDHAAELEHVPSAFLSVSLSAAEDSDEARAATQRCVDEFRAATRWQPTRTERIAGALQYREYNVFTRQLMRLLMKRMGHPTDTSHDYDYTDWDAVDRIGHELGQLAREPVAAGS
jgi:menaquinone-dependent protoporphyrinogen oxidase